VDGWRSEEVRVVARVVEEFFGALESRGYESKLRQVAGTVRCDLVRDGATEHWLVRIDHGYLSVSRDDIEADCVVRTDEETFARIVTGQLDALVALLRGMAVFEGSEELILALQRMLPGGSGQ
jgi:putative sterol carrier protein